MTRAKEHGKLLRQWRSSKGLSRVEAVEEVNKFPGVRVSYSHLNKLESVSRPLEKASLELREALRAIYGISREQWLEQVGLHIPVGPSSGIDKLLVTGEDSKQDPLARWQVSPNLVVFPVYHSASAGTGDGDPIDDVEAPIPRAHLTARGVHEAETMVILVNGDCMVSNDARSQESIKHHDFVAIHIGAPATPGKIGVFWDEQDDQLIIKGIGEGTDDHIILYPANGGPPVVRPKEDPELIYRGMVFWRGGNVN